MYYEFKHPEFGKMRILTVANKLWFLALDCYQFTGVDSRYLRNVVFEPDITKVGKQALNVNCPRKNVIVLSEKGIRLFVRRFAKKNASAYIKWLHKIATQVREALSEKRQWEATPKSPEKELLEKIVCEPAFGIRLLTEIQDERNRAAALEAQKDTGVIYMGEVLNKVVDFLRLNYPQLCA